MRRAMLAAVALMLTTVTGVARADGPDEQFLTALAADGINGDRDRLVAAGRDVCAWQSLPHNENPMSPYGSARIRINNDLAAQGVSPQQTTVFMRDAIVSYCPDKQTW